ncbi:MAG: DUF2442 domain-containing protein [Spirochaetes bacterium]|nr:DUF2442 domain-containing protein [Spirochaetota bacterium]
MHFVKNVKYLSEYKLLVIFKNGVIKQVDFKEHLNGEIFTSLKEINYFKTVRVNQDIDTIVWENGADFSPDFLYDIGIDIDHSALVK